MTEPKIDDHPHSLRGFALLVAEMRESQRSYFRTRSASDLAESKAREKRVDSACRAVLNPQQQGGLFS